MTILLRRQLQQINLFGDALQPVHIRTSMPLQTVTTVQLSTDDASTHQLQLLLMIMMTKRGIERAKAEPMSRWHESTRCQCITASLSRCPVPYSLFHLCWKPLMSVPLAPVWCEAKLRWTDDSASCFQIYLLNRCSWCIASFHCCR